MRAVIYRKRYTFSQVVQKEVKINRIGAETNR